MYYCDMMTISNAQSALRGAMDASELQAVDIASRYGLNINTVYKVLNGGVPSRLTLNTLKLIPGFAERYEAAA